MIKVAPVFVPGLETIVSCHMQGDSAIPQQAFNVTGSDGMELLDGNLLGLIHNIRRPEM